MANFVVLIIFLACFIAPWFFKAQVFALYRRSQGRKIETQIYRGMNDQRNIDETVQRMRDKGQI